MNNRKKNRTITSLGFILFCTVTILNSVTSVSAHETRSVIPSKTSEKAIHDDQVPTIDQERQLLLRVEQDKIGYNPEMRVISHGDDITGTHIAGDDVVHTVGKWGDVQNWPIIPVFVSLLYDGRVLAYDSVDDGLAGGGQSHTFTRATIWDPATNKFLDARVDTGYNLFCSGFASLPDGRLYIAGGNANADLDGLRETHLFSPVTDSWALGADIMQARRWYPSVTPLANGEMLITGGGQALSEVREKDGKLRKLTEGSQAYWANSDYPWLQTAPDGRVAFFGPDKNVGYVTTSGVGSWQALGMRDNVTRYYGSYAMYNIGKVLITGGGYQQAGYDKRSSVIINLNNNTIAPSNSMAHPRRQHNLTVLADGSVLATGGLSSNEGLVDLNNAVFAAELWNPSTGQWKTLASEARARQYHSTALLLPDGRVLSAGGGLCGRCQQVGYLQKNAQIFSPPYLFKPNGSGQLAVRPIIENVPAEMRYSQVIKLETVQADKIRKVALIRTGSVTHSQNMEQRYIPLSFTKQSGILEITTPENTNIAPPGHYMLFIIDNAGVPSIAKIVKMESQIFHSTVSEPICETGVDPIKIKKGEGTALWWWSNAVTSATINNGINSISVPSGYKWLYPEKNTTYKMTAKGLNGTTITCKTTIVVEE
ncbi:MAG: DUF1929 domain-containing protein [Methylococcales bacterium]|nr:DUF1929 domain-containing protein [Methylococcales bacterium]